MAGPFPAARIALLETTTGHIKTLIGDGTQAEYVETGHLTYLATGALNAVRFDRDEITLDPTEMLHGVVEPSDGRWIGELPAADRTTGPSPGESAPLMQLSRPR